MGYDVGIMPEGRARLGMTTTAVDNQVVLVAGP
jgi:hypothetical protein